MVEPKLWLSPYYDGVLVMMESGFMIECILWWSPCYDGVHIMMECILWWDPFYLLHSDDK